MAMSPGTIVGGYRILGVLGAGGMGTVYLAQHPSLPRRDAIKVLGTERSVDDEFRARFEREANLAAGLDHPNIVSVYNRGEEHGRLWIAMQYVAGTDVAAEMTRDPHGMNPLRALRIITEVGKGLDYAHRKGLLHRDIKPANFLLSTADGDEERVLLTDFGVAKASDDTSELTQAGSFVATIAYASPEQLSGLQLDPRSDIYSLACSLYKLLTGQNPYPSTQPTVVMMGHLHQPPPLATAANPGLPPAIDDVLARAMAKHPADRFASCREFTDAAADAMLPGRVPALTSTSPIRVGAPLPPTDPRIPVAPTELRSIPQPSGKRWGVIAAAAAVVVALSISAGVLLTGRDSPGAAPTAGPATATSAPPPTSKDQARAQNPRFIGTPILMVNITGTGRTAEPDMEVFLDTTPPTSFLHDIGLTYHPSFAKQGDEPSPRPIGKDSQYVAFSAVTEGYILAVRSDARAGGGGLLGLPGALLDTHATVLVVDDPQTVNAIRYWNSDSEQILLNKLVPVLKTGIK
ncbi:serine/threonine-protein kinase [Nocardia sp. NBC_00403]|uniref:serine/threonine-protein kinase n=1 Tax=Nocardia sp. NBC_00403 TaxID=2975990 RepID=UPI002E1E4EEB